MTDYFVRKDGNDTTGDGSTGTPWLTISKAILTVSIGGGHTINVGAGTYQESTSGLGYLYLSRAFSAEVIIQSESGNAADVIIQSATSTSFTVRLAAATNVTFANVTITPRTSTIATCVRVQDAGVNTLKFDGVSFSMETNGGILAYFSVAATNITFLGCALSQVGSNSITGIQAASPAGLTIDGCTIITTANNIRVDGTNTDVIISDTVCQNSLAVPSVRLDYTNRLTIDNLTATSIGAVGAVAFRVGLDGSYGTGNPTRDFIVKNSRFESTNSHGCLISSDAQDGVVEDCVIIGGDQGLVLKGVDNVTVRRCTMSTSVSGRAAYFKDARHCTFHSNRVIAYTGYALSADDAQYNRWLYNVVEAHNDANIYLWTGANVMVESDYNHYILTGAAAWGNPNGVVANSLAQVRAAWSGAFKTNDSKSNQLRIEA